ncbi:hypothetical protein F7725_012276 [Dissostichus mawsoni]|uniref:Uncharacterized protein n=1 Tax=Dissostichus mawsoni TaxID=36200 RepID=A0A7J5YLW3_DISMA|nr:hypothetical protein F7725_012276 [Dissostichus mawsoni]
MLSSESLQVAEEEVVLESSSNKLGDIYTFGKLYYVGPKKEEKREVVIEAERKRQIFLDCHFNDIGHHLGQKKTVHRIQSKFGAPKTIVCTQNTDFCDEAVSPLDPPQLNPLHDGSFSQLKEAVEQMVAEKQSQWDDFLDPVLANMTAAYKQEKKKNAKRRTHRSPSVTFKLSEPQYAAGDSPSPKKPKDSLYLSFPVEQISSEDMKTETLAFHLA